MTVHEVRHETAFIYVTIVKFVNAFHHRILEPLAFETAHDRVKRAIAVLQVVQVFPLVAVAVRPDLLSDSLAHASLPLTAVHRTFLPQRAVPFPVVVHPVARVRVSVWELKHALTLLDVVGPLSIIRLLIRIPHFAVPVLLVHDPLAAEDVSISIEVIAIAVSKPHSFEQDVLALVRAAVGKMVNLSGARRARLIPHSWLGPFKPRLRGRGR